MTNVVGYANPAVPLTRRQRVNRISAAVFAALFTTLFAASLVLWPVLDRCSRNRAGAVIAAGRRGAASHLNLTQGHAGRRRRNSPATAAANSPAAAGSG